MLGGRQISAPSADLGVGFDGSAPASGFERLGAGRSASSSSLPFDGGGTRGGIAGTAPPLPGPGLPGAGTTPALDDSITRDLQLAHVTNRCPVGTSESAMRFTVPQAAHVASIIRLVS